MRRHISIGVSVTATAILTYNLVFSAVHFDAAPSAWLVAVERLWSRAHGWAPMSHIGDFGHFYAPLVRFLCPLIGFALFWLLSRRHIGMRFWIPLAIAAVLAFAPTPGATPWVEAARAVLVLTAMMWGLGRGSRKAFHLATDGH